MDYKFLSEKYKGLNVLITGHTGFKGSWLSCILTKMGANVIGYSLEPPTNPSLFETISISNDINSNIGDIRDLPNLLSVLRDNKPDIVFHLAAQPLVRDSYKIPVDTYSTNVMGTVNILEVCRQTSSVKAIVNVTTDKCYENKEWEWGYRENDRLGGHDPYSNSKACSELITSAYRDSFFNDNSSHKISLASARAGNVIGGGDWASDRLIPDFIRSISKNVTLQIRSPFAIRPWQHVLEPLAGYLLLGSKLLEEGDKYAESWNFGPDDSDAKNVEWISKTLCGMWGNGAKYVIDENPQLHEANFLKLDCSKSKSRLKWFPKWDIHMALQKIVSWNQSYINGEDMRTITEDQIDEYFFKA